MTRSGLGVIVSAYRGDLPLVRACCASVRAHMPDLPICIVQDGAIPQDEFRRAYGATFITRQDVDPRLHRSYGYGLTKMIAFWHSPFERFLYVDSDTICWGDVLDGTPWRDCDFLHNEAHEPITDVVQRGQYFDPGKLFRQHRPFDWQNLPYFNTGCFVARRGIFDLADYLRLLDLQALDPTMLPCGEQGILNVLVFSAWRRGNLTIREWPLQAVVPVLSHAELYRRFRFRDGEPVISASDRRVIHWAGPKPYQLSGSAFRAPATFYRHRHRGNLQSRWAMVGSAALLAEEVYARVLGRIRSRVRTLALRARRIGIGLSRRHGAKPLDAVPQVRRQAARAPTP